MKNNLFHPFLIFFNKNSASKTLKICMVLRANKNNFCENFFLGNLKRKEN